MALDLDEFDADDLARMPAEKLARLTEVLRELHRRARQQRFARMFPALVDCGGLDYLEGPDGEKYYARELYPKHLEWFAASATHAATCLMAANRVGKTRAAAYAVTAHLTGLYPDWWPGRRFRRPISAWAAGDTNETTRDIIQAELLGAVEDVGVRKRVDGTGMIPADRIGELSWRQGVADLVDVVRVRHVSGGWSRLGLKAYAQGRKSMQGTAQHVIWCDEEPPLEVFNEMQVRLMTTSGIALLTFTPLSGLSETALQFMPQDEETA